MLQKAIRLNGAGLLAALGMALTTAACAPSSTSEPESRRDTASFCAAVDADQRQSTDGAVALRNLDAQIEGRAAYVARFPDHLDGRVTLTDLLLTRAQFRGAYDDFDEAMMHATAALARHPEEGAAHVLMARVLSATHRFDDALEALDEADARGADTADLRDAVALARGSGLEDVVQRRQARADAYPSYGSHAALAGAQAALGEFDAADRSFAAALEAYRDVSPLPLAWVAFQRGVMWSEQADVPEIGCARYREAVTRLPGYVVANVHLAELERRHDPERAADRLVPLLSQTSDPEPAGLLGTILADLGQGRAAELIGQAQARYDELLQEHPLAFADHAAEFFMGPGGEPERALGLALTNLDNRSNARAYRLAIRAATHAQRGALACELAAEADLLGGRDVPLAELVSEVLAACDD